jgi:hypothetical protein
MWWQGMENDGAVQNDGVALEANLVIFLGEFRELETAYRRMKPAQMRQSLPGASPGKKTYVNQASPSMHSILHQMLICM